MCLVSTVYTSKLWSVGLLSWVWALVYVYAISLPGCHVTPPLNRWWLVYAVCLISPVVWDGPPIICASFAFICIRLYSPYGLVRCYPYKARNPDNAVKQQDRTIYLMVCSKIVINRLNGSVRRLNIGNSIALPVSGSCAVAYVGIGKYCRID